MQGKIADSNLIPYRVTWLQAACFGIEDCELRPYSRIAQLRLRKHEWDLILFVRHTNECMNVSRISMLTRANEYMRRVDIPTYTHAHKQGILLKRSARA